LSSSPLQGVGLSVDRPLGRGGTQRFAVVFHRRNRRHSSPLASTGASHSPSAGRRRCGRASGSSCQLQSAASTPTPRPDDGRHEMITGHRPGFPRWPRSAFRFCIPVCDTGQDLERPPSSSSSKSPQRVVRRLPAGRDNPASPMGRGFSIFQRSEVRTLSPKLTTVDSA